MVVRRAVAAHVERWSQFHDDLAERLGRRARRGRRPARRPVRALDGRTDRGRVLPRRPGPKPDLVVLTSPALDSTLAGWKKTLASVLGRVTPTLDIPNGIDPRHDLARSVRRGEDGRRPVVRQDDARRGCGAEALTEQARVRAAAAGGARRARRSSSTASTTASSRATASEVFEAAPGVERRTYPGLRHELHNEPEGPQIVDEIIAWLRERVTERDTLPA